MQLETLADVRALIDKHLPAQLRAKPHWRDVAAPAALVIALALEGVQCRPK
jgi:hypothetical protein